MSGRVILHSDINCCYAAIEHLHHPELNGKPLAVGGDPESRHGIVLTADYIAKKYGVKTGMALWQAKQLCPDITFVSPRMDLYLRFSRMAHEIYAEYTDLQEAYGIDESWLDVTDSATIKGDGYSIAREISNRMKSELGITVSIGVSFNKIFAKLGSDYKKPDAITTMYSDEFQTKAWNLPVGDLLYVGRSTNQKLAKIGIRTIGDLARTDEEMLVSQLGKMGSVLWAFANGYDDSPVRKENTHAPIKSVGNSTTTHRDLVNDEDVKIIIYVLAESVAARLRENGFRCRVVEISIRDNELYSFTRQKKISNATNITEEIAVEAYKLFKDNYDWRKPIRSVGVRGADLVNDNYWEQIDLFCDFQMREKHMKMDAAVDDIRRRFGFYSVQRGLMYQDKVLSAVNAKEDHTVHPHGYFNQ
ncbi:MAG: DNA polymerase IV [Lachnospiraceae bacterium]|nr:DNA polymerase IV [Lachnospiraceae bacterium]